MNKEPQSAPESAKVLHITPGGKCPLTEAEYAERDAIVSRHIVVILKEMFQNLRSPRH